MTVVHSASLPSCVSIYFILFIDSLDYTQVWVDCNVACCFMSTLAVDVCCLSMMLMLMIVQLLFRYLLAARCIVLQLVNRRRVECVLLPGK